MKRLKLLMPAVLLTGSVYAQQLPTTTNKWLGLWKAEMNEKTFYERWTDQSRTILKGDSWRVSSNGDSVYFESLLLLAAGEDVFYEATVPGEHEKGIRFKLIESADQMCLFFCEKNEYPKYIRYTMKDPQHLEATIYNTDEDMVVFSFTRIQ
mgnify:CR=1 FL=1